MNKIMIISVLLVALIVLSLIASIVITYGHYEWKNWDTWSYPHSKTVSTDLYSRSDVIFKHKTDSSVIHGWLYKPHEGIKNHERVSVVLMCHGIGSQKDMGLDRYAIHFLKEGYAVVMIDYRSFGGSQSATGTDEMRHLINPWNHVDDVKSVIQSIENGELGYHIDPKSVILWGTSFGGGHVLEAVSELEKSRKTKGGIKGIISQVPHLDGRRASKRSIAQRGILGTLRIAIICAFDTLFSHIFDYAPFYIKIAGLKNETSYMVLEPDEMKKYYEKHPKTYLGGWKNMAPARSLAYMSFYNPINSVPDISVPILYIGASEDQLCPIDLIKLAVSKSKLKNAEFIEVKTGHHDVYAEPYLTQIANEMIAFMLKYAPHVDLHPVKLEARKITSNLSSKEKNQKKPAFKEYNTNAHQEQLAASKRKTYTDAMDRAKAAADAENKKQLSIEDESKRQAALEAEKEAERLRQSEIQRLNSIEEESNRRAAAAEKEAERRKQIEIQRLKQAEAEAAARAHEQELHRKRQEEFQRKREQDEYNRRQREIQEQESKLLLLQQQRLKEEEEQRQRDEEYMKKQEEAERRETEAETQFVHEQAIREQQQQFEDNRIREQRIDHQQQSENKLDINHNQQQFEQNQHFEQQNLEEHHFDHERHERDFREMEEVARRAHEEQLSQQRIYEEEQARNRNLDSQPESQAQADLLAKWKRMNRHRVGKTAEEREL